MLATEDESTSGSERGRSRRPRRHSHATDMKGRNFALRASGHVRVWPGTTGIKPLELGEIAAAVRAEFVDPMFEVMEGASFPRLGFSDH